MAEIIWDVEYLLRTSKGARGSRVYRVAISTIYELVRAQAQRTPEGTAILAPGRDSLTFARLHQQVQDVIARLNDLGVGRNDRVAVVLPNGPEAAVAFVSFACGATFAPLNPAYQASELEFYLSDLKARALIIGEGLDSPAEEVARGYGIPVTKLQAITDGPAGLFRLCGSSEPLDAPPGPAEADDVALVLHTSGTTSRPKMVPLTHRNLCESASNIQRSLQISPEDCCLNVMPLFHIHGLMAATLSSLAAGASVVCTPGFYAPEFLEWLAAFRPTWYTAVPTMHQAILRRNSDSREIISEVSLRFVRSSSAPLPPQVMSELERVFRAPVIEAYGMTEASHQIASNPLPPGHRKPGSVGPPAGPEVAIMAEESDEMLAAGKTGEIVMRGPSVTRGYANNQEANARAFVDGWLRTGDQGYVDTDGYLHLTGSLKEIINRGGEKISPREVDLVLLDHPAVKQAVAFPIPDRNLGEDVAAAVVLSDPAVTEKELRQFVSSRLASFKVPRRVVILEDIPKGPTGKIQRVGLADRLGLSDAASSSAASGSIEFVAPRTDVEEFLTRLWQDVLGLPAVSVYQRFLDSGGDSMLAARLVARIRQMLSIELTLLDFFDAPTIAQQAEIVEDLVLLEIEQMSEAEAQRSLRAETGEGKIDEQGH